MAIALHASVVASNPGLDSLVMAFVLPVAVRTCARSIADDVPIRAASVSNTNGMIFRLWRDSQIN